MCLQTRWRTRKNYCDYDWQIKLQGFVLRAHLNSVVVLRRRYSLWNVC